MNITFALLPNALECVVIWMKMDRIGLQEMALFEIIKPYDLPRVGVALLEVRFQMLKPGPISFFLRIQI